MSENEELVSVVIPFYNCERFLGEAIESVRAQTYAQWELLLVDDGSTDGSTQIAQDYAAKPAKKIRYLEHEGHANRGVNASRNLGAQRSRGNYLAFLDSDDIWLPKRIEASLQAIRVNPEAAMTVGPTEYWYDWDVQATPFASNSIPPIAPGPKLYLPPALFLETYPIGPSGAPCTCSYFIRREAFEAVHGFEESFNPSTYQVYEDIAFLTAVFLRYPVFVLDRPFDRYRFRSGSMWNSASNTTREEGARRYYFQWLRNTLKRTPGIRDEDWKIVRRAAWPYWLPFPSQVTLRIRRFKSKLSRIRSR